MRATQKKGQETGVEFCLQKSEIISPKSPHLNWRLKKILGKKALRVPGAKSCLQGSTGYMITECPDFHIGSVEGHGFWSIKSKTRRCY